MTTSPPLEFKGWYPDLPDLGNPGETVATNVIPKAKSYGPFPGLTVFSNALTARCQGAVSLLDNDGNVNTFAGDATKLYKLNNADATFSDVSRLAGGAYTIGADATWNFVQFGSAVIALDGVDVPQTYTLGSSSNFAALSGSPPTAKYGAVVRDQVVLANLSTDPRGVRWSGVDDATAWTASQTTLSDSQSIQGDGGWIQGIVGGEYGRIYQERAVVRMDFIGVPNIYEFNRVATARGLYAPGSLASIDKVDFYLSDDGFYGFDGVQSKALGKNKIDSTFFDELLDPNYKHRITATIDPTRALYIVGFPLTESAAGTPDRLLVYNWSVDKWSLVSGISVEILLRHLTPGYTLETLDNLSSSLDALPFSLDSRAYTGGAPLLAGFDTSHKLNYFTGSNLAATVETAEYQLQGNKRAFVQNLRPFYDGGTLTAQIGYRETPSGTVTYDSATSINTYGYVPKRKSVRYCRARLSIAAAGTWSHLQGLVIDSQPDGER